MKIKKILSVILAAAAIISTASINVLADEASSTYCFDTNTGLSNWQIDLPSNSADMKLSIDSSVKEDGAGSLAVYQNVKQDIPKEFVSAYITSDKLGLENFAGCSMKISYKFNPDFEGDIDNFSIYSNGVVWISTNIPNSSNKNFSTASVIVPSNAKNTIFGFTIPSLKKSEGTAIYIDNVSIIDAEGNTVANVGDYEIETSANTKTTGTATHVIMIILLVILILAVVGGCGYVVLKLIKKFR